MWCAHGSFVPEECSPDDAAPRRFLLVNNQSRAERRALPSYPPSDRSMTCVPWLHSIRQERAAAARPRCRILRQTRPGCDVHSALTSPHLCNLRPRSSSLERVRLRIAESQRIAPLLEPNPPLYLTASFSRVPEQRCDARDARVPAGAWAAAPETLGAWRAARLPRGGLCAADLRAGRRRGVLGPLTKRQGATREPALCAGLASRRAQPPTLPRCQPPS